MNQPSAIGSITVDHLVALNDEIRALVRAGVPLEQGLLALGEDLPGRLGRLARTLGRHLERGESLVEALDSAGEGFPAAYRAVVAAGIRSNRLPAALESISQSVRQAAEARRSMLVAMVYPLLVLLLATILFTFTVIKVVPLNVLTLNSLDVAIPGWYLSLQGVSETVFRAIPWLWLGLLAMLLVWFFRSRAAVRWGSTGLRWLPTIAKVRHLGHLATFSDLLALLVEQGVPLPEAVQLAAAAGGGRELNLAGVRLSAALSRGDSSANVSAVLPAFLSWLILTAKHPAYLARALRYNADLYRRRAAQMSVLLGTYVPIFMSALIGAVGTFCYVVLTLAPFYFVLRQVSGP